jgi:hypothetical protein
MGGCSNNPTHLPSKTSSYCSTMMPTGCDGMPLAITTISSHSLVPPVTNQHEFNQIQFSDHTPATRPARAPLAANVSLILFTALPAPR